MEEIWKDIPSYEGYYQVSSYGVVKSLNYNGTRREGILKPSSDHQGYLHVVFCVSTNRRTFTVHKLVAMAFLNHKPDGTQKIVVDHIDNNNLNNRLENLQLISPRHNTSKDKNGYSSKHIGVSLHKLTDKWQANIRVNSNKEYLGLFNCEFAAAVAYQKRLKEIGE